jgi:mono/diheme cytochrome c family protein
MNRLKILILICATLTMAMFAHGSADAAPPAARGKQVFDRWCAACHARGPGHPGTQSLQVKYKGERPAALEDRTDLSPTITAFFTRHGVALMPQFRKTEISDAELKELSAYLAKKK